MALSRPGDGSFIEEFGRDLGTKRVTVSPGTVKPARSVEVFEGHVQAARAFFNVNTPIYEGDQLEWDDPRGGERRVFVTNVKVIEAGGEMDSSMAHILVAFSDTPPAPGPDQSRQGHVIVVNGSNVNIAFEGSTITQQVRVAAGYEELADVVGKALAVIEQTNGVDPDEVRAARDSAAQAIEEASKPTPDPSVIKRLLPTIRGVLNSAAAAGAGALATGLVAQLFVQ